MNISIKNCLVPEISFVLPQYSTTWNYLKNQMGKFCEHLVQKIVWYISEIILYCLNIAPHETTWKENLVLIQSAATALAMLTLLTDYARTPDYVGIPDYARIPDYAGTPDFADPTAQWCVLTNSSPDINRHCSWLDFLKIQVNLVNFLSCTFWRDWEKCSKNGLTFGCLAIFKFEIFS